VNTRIPASSAGKILQVMKCRYWKKINERERTAESVDNDPWASHSAAVLLAEIGTIGAYKNARQVAGNAGLTPVELRCGSSATASACREHAICTW